MALPKVKFLIKSGNLGALLAIADGVAGYVLTGVSAGDITAGTPFKVSSLQGAVDLGLVVATNPLAYKTIKEHYDECPTGTDCYIMIVTDAMTVNMMADKTNVNGARKLLDFAEGNIRILGLLDYNDTPTITAGIDANVYTAKTNAQALAVEYAGEEKQAPFWCIIGATNFSGTAANLTDQNNSTDDYVSLFLGDSEVANTGASIGLFIGRECLNPVQRSAARVRSGAITMTTAYIGAVAVTNDNTLGTAIHDKGFVTFRKFVRKNGYFFTSDFTCTASTSDFKRGARRRIMNKIQVIAYAVAVEEIEEEVPTDPATGLIDASYAKYLEQQMERQVNPIMTGTGEISGFTAIVDLNQNVVSTSLTKFKLLPVPVGYNGNLEGELAFSNPAVGS